MKKGCISHRILEQRKVIKVRKTEGGEKKKPTHLIKVFNYSLFIKS